MQSFMLKKNVVLLLCAILLCACSNKKQDTPSTKEEGYVVEASLIKVSKHDGYTQVKILDPWHSDKTLHDYILIPKGSAAPSDLPKGTIIHTPIERALVYSSVHAQVIKELGKISAVSGVCDAEYFKIPEIAAGLKDGKITNAGSSMAPTIEKIIALNPEIIILSPFQNGGYGTIATLGIPILECADYMEESPIGRAEWVKLFGLLFGNKDKAEELFNHTQAEYNAIKEQVSVTNARPKVITEMVTSGVWFVPGGNSYMAHIITDAGATYPWSDNTESGSLQLDFAQVLNTAHDADFWLIKTSNIKSYADLKQAYTLNDRFDAFSKKNVWVCDTQTTSLFEEFPFHPELLLKELALIFHPELNDSNYKYRYYQPLTDK